MSAKVDQIIEAIDDLFSDTSVGPSETLERLLEIQDAVQSKLEALKADGVTRD
jgi:hypothetical protein